MSITDADLQQHAAALAEALLARRWRLATAESLTGGWIAKVCTELPGSSAWFDCAFVTYSPQAKQQMLGLPAALLEEAGVVSEAVAAAMASAALARSQADIALAVTGLAGPGGGCPSLPVGTVCVAWVDRERIACQPPPWTSTWQLRGDREQIRRQTVGHALLKLGDMLNNTVSAC